MWVASTFLHIIGCKQIAGQPRPQAFNRENVLHFSIIWSKTIDINRSGLPARIFFALKFALSVEIRLTNTDEWFKHHWLFKHTKIYIIMLVRSWLHEQTLSYFGHFDNALRSRASSPNVFMSMSKTLVVWHWSLCITLKCNAFFVLSAWVQGYEADRSN